MNPRFRSLLRLTTAAALTIAAVVFTGRRIGELHKSGEEGATVWFYDLSERRLYEVPRDTIPPHRGIGGPGNDGVRAVIVAFRGEQTDPARRRIAYLETCRAELKELLERIRSAHASARPVPERVPDRASEFFRTNTLVKYPEEAEWHVSSSPQGLEVMNRWRAWKGQDGQPPVICAP